MPRLTETITVKASPRQIADYLLNPGNLASYLPVSNVEVLEQSKDGLRIRHDLALGDKKMPMVCVWQVAEPGRKIRFRATEGMSFSGTWLLQEIPGGTQITYVLEYEPFGGLLAKLLDGLTTRKQMQQICGGALRKLKEAQEAAPRAA
ncbi:MAG: SRPBCC family protein [Chloroflexi bacterium]|nr:SRPBCC family protein [Chloroflexota bacterium]